MRSDIEQAPLERVRQLLGRARRKSGQRVFSPEARRAAATWAHAAKQKGVPLAQAAKQLGVNAITLSQWVRERPATDASPFVALTCLEPRVDRADERPALVVHHVGGVRIEGLTLEQLAELLRRLA